uniref:uncharacterized protein C16orf46 homolog n=1 Tax=Monopterus albus TaxID=43700 RepID=UPI0009B38CC7|nr:uncharacterized protein LOC109965044 [Monopterus albus]
MATLKEVDHTAAKGSDMELPAQGDVFGEQPYETLERRHVDALLDISEEDLLKEQEPYEYHCYSGREEAVRGWARVAPLSCILLTQKRYRKAKHKEADNMAPLPVDPPLPNTDRSASIAERRWESHAGPSNSFKKSTLLNQQMGSCHNAAVAALQPDTSQWSVLSVMQKIESKRFLNKKTEEEGTRRDTPLQLHHLSSNYSMSENRPTKPQKYSQRPNSALVPIKNITFLPPIKSPHLNLKDGGQLCICKKAPEGESLAGNCFDFDKKNGTLGTKVDHVPNTGLSSYSAALTSKYWTCQDDLHLFSALSDSVPRNYQALVSSKPIMVDRTSVFMGKSLTEALHCSTAANVNMHTSCLSS